MTESQSYLAISKEDLFDVLRQHKQQGFRLVQITATAKDGFDLLYSLERESEMVHLRIALESGQWVYSVSGMFPHAFLYENEIKDLFGIDIHGMSIDFRGKLYRTSVQAPFSGESNGGEADPNR